MRCRLRSWCQGLVVALALEAGDTGLIGVERQDARALVSPALQVGKHSGGGAGCLAVGESGGIAAARTPGNALEGVNVAGEQPLSITCPGSVSKSTITVLC